MDEMNNTLKVLQELNKFKDNVIYTENEVEEEKENIKEFKEIYRRLEKTLKELENISEKKEDSVVEQLIQLHLVYSDFVWHYDQMDGMIKKMIAQYR